MVIYKYIIKNSLNFMIINFYDEFGVYTNKDDIASYIEDLVSQGETDENIIFEKCIKLFGEGFSTLIKEVMYGED